MNIWLMAIICGIFSTMLVNPYFITRIFRGMKEFKDRDVRSLKTFWEWCGFKFSALSFWVVQAIFFTIGTLITAPLMYWFCCMRTLLGMLGYFWIVAVLHAINALIIYSYCGRYKEKESLCRWGWLTFTVLFVLWTVPYIHAGVYNALNPVGAHTYLEEEQVPVISVDVVESLNKECILEGYTLKSPVVRQGKVVYPLSRDGNVAIAGYVILDDDQQPIFVKKDIYFSPYQYNKNSLDIVFREHFPDKVVFGDWSFQLDQEGEVWFVRMYGHHTCLRGGREIEGLISINGSTGDVVSYKLEEIPIWVTGISE